MQLAELIAEGERTMTVCNACRYCEQYCPVFMAMERRQVFNQADLMYLANLCHNCGECLYACQYAPPHQFAITVPRTLAATRLASYEHYTWPRPLGRAFRHQGVRTSILLAAGLTAVLLAATWMANPDGLFQVRPRGDFYSVMPHGVMVSLFGGVGAFVALAVAVGAVRFWREVNAGGPLPTLAAVSRGFVDAMTIRHLHSAGHDCVSGEEARTPWRRIFHHCTFYGFMLCFASTTVAAAYHSFFGWEAPYPYLSAPVILGTVGGIGLLVGPVGLWFVRRTRDQALMDPDQSGLDDSFLAMLFLTSLTGLLLLALRDGPAMTVLLLVHLAVVLALFLTLPYGKFVHGFYRTMALVKHRQEEAADHQPQP